MTAASGNGGQQVLQGANLLFARAGNKGAVCLPFRFHHSTLAVVAAHLPADGSRGSRVEQRNAALRAAFRDAVVAGEAFDVHLQFQHTILLGESEIPGKPLLHFRRCKDIALSWRIEVGLGGPPDM